MWNELKKMAQSESAIIEQQQGIPEEHTWGITRKDVEEMLERFYAKSRQYYDTRESFFGMHPDMIAQELDNDFETFNRYLRNLSEDAGGAKGLLKAYYEGRLPEKLPGQKQTTPDIQIKRPVAYQPKGLAYEPKQVEPVEDVKSVYNIAEQRITKSNKEEVMKARKQIFLQRRLDKELYKKLGINKSKLTQKIRSWSGTPVDGIDFENNINTDKDLAMHWTGITNSSYISKYGAEPEEVDAYVGKIEASENSGWLSPNGEQLRRYILRTLDGIDTQILYNDLNFKVETTLKPRGRYLSQEKTIEIRENDRHTVAHEIGHYLDHKWGEEIGLRTIGIVRGLDSINWEAIRKSIKLTDEHIQWAKRLYEFMMELSLRSELSSEYYQERHEVFARFVAKFVDWVNKKAGQPTWDLEERKHIRDKFSDIDFVRFIQLLQEKAYVDSLYVNDKTNG